MIKNFIEKNGFEFYEEASLKKYNTYRIDINCKYLVLPKDKEEFQKQQNYLLVINVVKLLKMLMKKK